MRSLGESIDSFLVFSHRTHKTLLTFFRDLVSKGHSRFEALPLTNLKQQAFALSSWVSTDTLCKNGFKPLQGAGCMTYPWGLFFSQL